jgi:hypothetical protein
MLGAVPPLTSSNRFNGHQVLRELQLLESKFLSKETTVRLFSYSSTAPGESARQIKAAGWYKADLN